MSPLGWRHGEGGVDARTSMVWVPGCRRHMCPKAPMRRFRSVVVRGDGPMRMRIEAFMT